MVDQTLRPPSPNQLEQVTTAILGAVEQQLSRYFTAMNQRMDAVQQVVDQQRERAMSDQRALQQAVEARLDALAEQQHRRFVELQQHVEMRIGDAVPGPATGIDAETMLEIRQAVRGDMERSFGAIQARLDELGRADRTFDEQATALGLRVIDTAEALARRMDAGTEQLAQAVDGKLQGFQRDVSTALEGLAGQMLERTTILQGKIDASESRSVDRALALEGRLKDDLGRKIAEMDAVLGRTANGFDEAIVAMSRRILELENRFHDTDTRLSEIAERIGRLDESVLDEFRKRVDHAIGEATLVRIEIDRLVASTRESLDHSAVRLSQIEEMVSDVVDVSATVQLERLDDLERQMLLLAPHVPRAAPEAPAVPALSGNGYDSYDSYEAGTPLTTH